MVVCFTLILVELLQIINLVSCEILNPPYFNIAEGRKITASSTCGEGVSDPELYCKLVGSNWINNHGSAKPIEGQACDYCNPAHPKLSHSAEFAIDGTERWWQSPPLSRGMKYSMVNLTIDLGQEFHVAYVYITMANSPRPGVWILERSKDFGKTFTPWQYFADSREECTKFFGTDSLNPIIEDDSVTCETKFSKVVPLENGEMIISLLADRPSAANFSMSQLLQEFTKATNVRLRLLRPKTALGQFLIQDPTVTRRYFYSIKDINIGGRCVCNGHAGTCDMGNSSEPEKLYCKCQHNTCGAQCEMCCPGYVQKKWKPATVESPNICEPCNCHSHSIECVYSEEVDQNKTSLDIHGQYDGGGICINCLHNTEGINCEKCKFGYYRPQGRALDALNACEKCRCSTDFHTGSCDEETGHCHCKEQYTGEDCDRCSYGYYDFPECKPCVCFLNGTYGDVCNPETSECVCKTGFAGSFCKECADTYYGFPECKKCECDFLGSISSSCNFETGQCLCKTSYGSRTCNQCNVGYYNHPNCQQCDCDRSGALDEVCDNKSGRCLCKPGYAGEKCDQCESDYYGFPNCVKCECHLKGSFDSTCSTDGKCRCLINFGSAKCDQCAPGYYRYPECKPCNCDPSGSIGVSCFQNGLCYCKPSFEGEKCDKCKENFYNYPLCEGCNCNLAGVVQNFTGCNVEKEPGQEINELCKCKERVTGRLCQLCKSQYWNLKIWNPYGCEPCRCNQKGTVNGLNVCDGVTGQCLCREKVTGRSCDGCKDGNFAITEGNYFGCTDCECDIGGATDQNCNKETGKCNCRPRIEGRQCEKPVSSHYYPTLHQHQFEFEIGRSPGFKRARYEYDENVFPGYSWKGYAVFSELQNEILLDVYIPRTGFYKIIFKYINKNLETVIGDLTLTQEYEDPPQVSKIYFEPSKKPKMFIVTGRQGEAVNPLYLTSGQWKASLKIDKPILADYMVFLPQNYYEATLMRKEISKICLVNQTNKLCRHLSFLKYPESAIEARGEFGYSQTGNTAYKTQKFVSDGDFKMVNGNMARMDSNQDSLTLNMDIPKSGTYILIVNYQNPNGNSTNSEPTMLLSLSVQGSKKKAINGTNLLANCPYNFICRHVVQQENGSIVNFDLESENIDINMKLLKPLPDLSLGLHSIVAMPIEDWNVDYVQPRLKCIKKDSECVQSSYPTFSEAIKVQVQNTLSSSSINTQSYLMSDESSSLYLMDLDSAIEVKGEVPNFDFYYFVVHYSQPNHSKFDINVGIKAEEWLPAVLPIKFCPNEVGCRTLIQAKFSNITAFPANKEFTILLDIPKGKKVNIDYILAVPKDSFSPQMMKLEMYDEASEFLNTCAHNAFYIDQDASSFCKKSVFSITSHYNNGALSCRCNPSGSKSFECNVFGGQCECKPNVIGRQCEECKTGYYGFPDCKPCNCSRNAAYCHPVTGQCICPSRVIGADCNKCADMTFGYDPIHGCEECNCNTQGVRNNNLQCNLTTGVCDCKPNIGGRTCNFCKAGHFSFPYCQYCGCDVRGTTKDICDPKTGHCFCKDNVQGATCDQCKSDAYHLEEKNPLGCTKCFCFGASDRCRSSTMQIVPIQAMNHSEWSAVILEVDDKGVEEVKTEENIEIEFFENQISAKLLIPLHQNYTSDQFSKNIYPRNLYFKAPSPYCGNRIASYGGQIRYFIKNEINSESDLNQYNDTLHSYSLILTGNNITIVHDQDEQPDSPGSTHEFVVELLENKFHHSNGIAAVSHAQMMMVLVKLDAIYIRGSYFEPSKNFLTNFSMDSASNKPGNLLNDSLLALRVEECFCPANYRGSSCEECSPGYFRAKAGPYLGYCVPCQCNGHSNSCDPKTGICFNCQNNTLGDHCEKCEAGYHGDATKGNCLICACPLPISTNNFAESCEVSSSGIEIMCKCKPGYAGSRCSQCDSGHFGIPTVPLDTCKPCECNDNIDPNDYQACDPVSGICYNCLNNTAGQHCEHCAVNYFGDAINLKNCAVCECDTCGSESCDQINGDCKCKPNVEGLSCNKCKINFWNFNQCTGCESCNCGLAAVNNSCDITTGQCACQPGAGGRYCEGCLPGFWNYSEKGCESCRCVEKYSFGVLCNENTGQCNCMPGVVGERCDSCPHRWVFIENYGCQACSTCHHFLLDETDQFDKLVDPTLNEMQEASFSVLAYQKLSAVNSTINEKVIQVQKLKDNPDKVNLEALKTNAREIETMKIESQYNKAFKNGQVASDNAKDIVQNAMKSDEMTYKIMQKVMKALNEVKNLDIGLARTPFKSDTDTKIEQGLETLERIQKIDLKNRKMFAENENFQAQKLVTIAKNFSLPTDLEKEKISNAVQSLNKLKSNLFLFAEQIDASRTNTIQAQRNVAKSLHILKEENDILSFLNRKHMDSEEFVKKGKALKTDAEEALTDAKSHFDNIFKDSEALDNKKANILDQSSIDDSELEELIRQAKLHLRNLTLAAENLRELFKDTKAKSHQALQAAQVNSKILEALEKAGLASQEAADAAQEAEESSRGTNLKVSESVEASQSMKQAAQTLEVRVNTHLNLTQQNTDKNANKVENLVKELTNRKLKILEGLDVKVPEELDKNTSKAIANSEEAYEKTKTIMNQIQTLNESIDQIKNESKQVLEENQSITDNVRDTNVLLGSVLPSNITFKIEKSSDKLNRLVENEKNLINQIEKLKRDINLAISEANRIDLGVTFYPDTTLQLRNPDNLKRSGSYTKLSMFFKTRAMNGLLAYIGNPVLEEEKENNRARKKRNLESSKSNDFLALEIRNGKLVATIDLGSGPQMIRAEEAVNTGEWHQVIVERIGKYIMLKILRVSGPPLVAHGIDTGYKSVFDLSDQKSRIYIGGIPRTVKVQDSVKFESFQGQIEEVTLGDTPLGLWNFVQGQYNLHGSSPRTALKPIGHTNSLSFDGKGYAMLTNTRHNFETETTVSFSFRSYAKEGLLFLIGGDQDYFALSLENGKVMLIFDLGSGYTVVESRDTFNDGEWHRVEASRVGKDVILKIDKEEMGSASAFGRESTLDVKKEIYFGGVASTHNFARVTGKSFEGCIKDVQIGAFDEVLTDTKSPSLGVSFGCPAAMVREASFASDSTGFIAMRLNFSLNERVQVTCKFRTDQPNNLLFYASNSDHSSYVAVYLEQGNLAMRVEPGEKIITSNVKYNDNEWHYIIATKNQESIRLDIDDISNVFKKSYNSLDINSDLIYFGGSPDDYHPALQENSIPLQFIGCLGDITINDEFQNFINSIQRPGASLVTCSDSQDSNKLTSQLFSNNTLGTPFGLYPTTTSIATTQSSEESTSKQELEPSTQSVPQFCKLPLIPNRDPDVRVKDGQRFGNSPTSRIEYVLGARITTSLLDESKFSLEFKTSGKDGVIFYITDANNIDFVGLYMQSGKIYYSWNCGSGIGLIAFKQELNDNEWHHVFFERTGKEGKFKVDDSNYKFGYSKAASNSLNIRSPLFIGGLNEELVKSARSNLQNVVFSFPGCIRNVKIDSEQLDFSHSESFAYESQPCSSKIEPGNYFTGHGYVTHSDNYRVGKNLLIEMEIKPRNVSGILFAVRGNRDYVILEIKDGDVIFRVDNGAGAMVITWKAPEKQTLCDGDWHSIFANKIDNMLTMRVDSNFVKPEFSPGGVNSADTDKPLYIGGLPPNHEYTKLNVSPNYVGCIKNFKLKSKEVNFNSLKTYGKIILNTCPTL